ncbi:MAG: M20/M25/M40 family metallo-hydrolase [Hyphomonadaceae bacterium]|nr:M20/M25/M40 family metallo-hydrolase [Hyphomonadaceae bacterium]
MAGFRAVFTVSQTALTPALPSPRLVPDLLTWKRGQQNYCFTDQVIYNGAVTRSPESMLSVALTRLEELVAMDTQNGTGDEIACVKFLAQSLAKFHPDRVRVETVKRSRGKPGSGYVLAVWGQPRILLNVHIDTVPAAAGWTTGPHTLRDAGDRVIGLGACDIKGAAACILAALEHVGPGNVAVLFSGDEEHGSEVMPEIIRRGHHTDAPMAIVCEPTGCKIGRQHRGIIAYGCEFTGRGGHSSLADVTEAPLFQAARLAAAVGEYGGRHRTFGAAPYQGLCTNIGEIKTDGSYNVIPTTASLKFSLRPPPGDDVEHRHRDVLKIAGRVVPGTELQNLVKLLPFMSRNPGAFENIFADRFEVADLQYWTEAALLSDAGLNCIVYGPGDLEQAHKPDEFVTKFQLGQAAGVYGRVLEGDLQAQNL